MGWSEKCTFYHKNLHGEAIGRASDRHDTSVENGCPVKLNGSGVAGCGSSSYDVSGSSSEVMVFMSIF